MAVDQTAFQSPGTGFGERCDTWTTVWGPFGLNSYTTLVTTDEPSTTMGHSKENFLGPSIHVMVPSTRPDGKVPSYTPLIWASTRTSWAHQAPSCAASVRASNTCAGIAPTVAFAFARMTGGPTLGAASAFAGIGASGMPGPPPNVGGLHNPDEASRGLETRLARCARPRSASKRVLASGADEATVLLALEARAVEEPLADRRMMAIAHRGDHVSAIVAQMLDRFLPRDVPLIGHQDHEDQDESADDQPDHPALEAPFVLEGHVGPGDRHGAPMPPSRSNNDGCESPPLEESRTKTAGLC